MKALGGPTSELMANATAARDAKDEAIRIQALCEAARKAAAAEKKSWFRWRG
jgi:hypothetical protein